MSYYARGARKEQETDSSTDHGWIVVDATDRGRPVTAAFSFFLGCVADIQHFPFNGCVLTSPTIIRELLCLWSINHGWIVVDATDRGRPITVSYTHLTLPTKRIV